MAGVRIKVCGVTCVEDAEACVAAGVFAIGLNFVPSSPRVISIETAQRIAAQVGDRALVVAVVADLSLDEVRALVAATGAGCVQLHGEEPPSMVSELAPRAYKAVRIGGPDDVTRARSYPGAHLLVDAKVPGKLGGTGALVDLGLVAPLSRERKLTLAGGLNPDNVAEAIRAVSPFGVDVASGVETPGRPRRKDPARIEAFVRAVRVG